MTKRKTRYFWFLSDQKTIREIEGEQFRKMCDAERNRSMTHSYSRLLCRLHYSGEVYLRTRRSGLWVHSTQLRALMNLEREL